MIPDSGLKAGEAGRILKMTSLVAYGKARTHVGRGFIPVHSLFRLTNGHLASLRTHPFNGQFRNQRDIPDFRNPESGIKDIRNPES